MKAQADMPLKPKESDELQAGATREETIVAGWI
jgi:hypothetical protein